MKNIVSFRAPSNIAFIKYWGKFGRQYPLNPSLSMTLDKCFTETEILYRPRKDEHAKIEFEFEKTKNTKFESRIQNYLKSIEDISPELKNYDLTINSKNSFPHSAGIASSASAMAALAGCLVAIEESINNAKYTEAEFQNRSSLFARLASGSACRSIKGPFQIWGENQLENGNNEFATSFKHIHDKFKSLNDSILIISGKEKSVSSSQGHILMNGHFFKDARIEQANENFRQICSAIKLGDYDTFGEVLENEALTLHALMMSSFPSFILLEPNSIEVLNRVKKFRSETKVPLYFTIDAGPNIHLIYPDEFTSVVLEFITHELKDFYEKVIHDHCGVGLMRLDGNS